MENTFKSSVFGGFNRDDVIRYIEKTALESKQQLEALEQESDGLCRENAELRDKLAAAERERDSLKESYATASGAQEALKKGLTAAQETIAELRAQRLGVDHGNIYVLAETDLNTVLATIDDLQPTVLIVDSIQTMYDAETASTPGSISQVRECTMRIMRSAKDSGYTAFVVGHINKEGSIAGPKVLEHMVDCVLYFEGDQSTAYRILRAAKNRFGSTNEIGVFEMEDFGLREVTNPSEMLLSGRPSNTPGTCVVGVMEGSRTVLAEVQALITPSGYSGARRNANGIDYNRAMLLLAVLEKRAGFSLSSCDAYINVVGGLRLDEPATDLAVILAIASSYKDLPVGSDLAAVGEVGLSGEIRSVSHLNQRLSEIARLGFRRCIIPAHVRDDVQKQNGLETIPVKNIREALRAVFGT